MENYLMTSKLLLNDLLYLNEHLTCKNYLSIVDVGFKYIELNEDTSFSEESATRNYLLFIVKGECNISCNQYMNQAFRSGEMILLPKSSVIKGIGRKELQMVALTFDMPQVGCDKLALQALSELCQKIEYNFSPVPIRYPITTYLELLTYCLKNGMNCHHFHLLKENELFLLLRGFYSKEELATLFYCIIGKELDFKNFILENFHKVNNVNELIALSTIGRTTFFNKFKEVFGISIKQWMLKQTNEHLLHRITEPGITIKTIMTEFNFETQAHLTHYCKQQFGCTPKKLIKKYTSDNQ